MTYLNPQDKSDEMLEEKHVPIFIHDESGKEFIQVGSTLHPMSESIISNLLKLFLRIKIKLNYNIFLQIVNP